jgi:hypothetical protein
VLSFTPQPLYPQGKSPRYPLGKTLGGPQSQCGRRGREKILGPTRTRTPIPWSASPVASRYTGYTIPAHNNNVTSLINSVNTAQHATIEEAVFSFSTVTSQQWIVITLDVFSVHSTDAPLSWLDSDRVIPVYCRSRPVPRLYELRIIAAEARGQARKRGDRDGKFVVEEEL